MPDNSNYKDLLRHEIDLTLNQGQRKRRRRVIDEPKKDVEAIVIDDTSANESEGGSGSDSDSDSDDFEDVEINPLLENIETFNGGADETITITLGNPDRAESESDGKKKRKANIVSKEERRRRVLVHKGYLLSMLCHGTIRNQWCNSPLIKEELKKSVPRDIQGLLTNQNGGKEVLDIVKSRRFLDGLKKIMTLYRKKFRRTSSGLIRKNWNELKLERARADKDITFSRFKKLVLSFRGSRDIGAQGFVAMLRSIGIQARLIFSLQPPDFTSVTEKPPQTGSTVQAEDQRQTIKKVDNKLLNRFGGGGGFGSSSRRNFLGSIRNASTVTHDEAKEVDPFTDSEFPIFWIEAWNKYSKHWVSIDPISLEIIETAPMRRKSSFEPPSTDTRNQLTYVMAFDRYGNVKDVTRRYSQFYNAKTCRKRISYRGDSQWYENMIRGINKLTKKDGSRRMDALEMKEFHDRDLAEGMPNNLSNFKNHPLYAIESQLRQNEVIYPMDKTSQCGMFRNKTKSKNRSTEVVIPIYKRSTVHTLRSARAWYMRGRTLKIGVNPLKVKTKNNRRQNVSDSDNGSDTEDDNVRLYADFQTQLYIPPPIIDGKIQKNAYGNIDIYTETMIPENGYLIPVNEIHNMKLLERAAKYILNIDFARAIVGFDFGSAAKGKGYNRTPTTKEGGILIDIQYKEAISVIIDNLVEEEEQAKKDFIARNALKNWKFFLTKLRISKRLDEEHGKVEKGKRQKGKADSDEDSDDSDAFSVQSDSSGEEMERGGFVVDDYQDSANKEEREVEEEEEEKEEEEGEEEEEYVVEGPSVGGGFLVESEDEVYGGGFMEAKVSDGGFIVDEHDFVEENGSEGGFIVDELDYIEGNGSGGFVVEGEHAPMKAIEYIAEEGESGGFFEHDEEFIGGKPISKEEEETTKGIDENVDTGDVYPCVRFLEANQEIANEKVMIATEESTRSPNQSDDEDLLNSIPTEYFKEDENGELIYDPSDAAEHMHEVVANFSKQQTEARPEMTLPQHNKRPPEKEEEGNEDKEKDKEEEEEEEEEEYVADEEPIDVVPDEFGFEYESD